MSNSLVELPPWSEPDPDESRVAGLVSRLARADGPADAAGTWPEELWSLILRGRGDAVVAAPGVRRRGLPPAAPGPAVRAAGRGLAHGRVHPLAARRRRPPAERRGGPAGGTEVAGGDRLGQGVRHRRHLPAHDLAAAGLAGARGDASSSPGGYRLQGAMPWVTAAERADVFVTGALLDDGRQLLITLPADRPGLSVKPPFELAALQASCTAEVVLDGVQVDESDLLAGPTAELSAQPGAVGTAGLETSALALGQARARARGPRRAGGRTGRADRSGRRPLRDVAADLVVADGLRPGRRGRGLGRARCGPRPTPWPSGPPRPT